MHRSFLSVYEEVVLHSHWLSSINFTDDGSNGFLIKHTFSHLHQGAVSLSKLRVQTLIGELSSISAMYQTGDTETENNNIKI